MWPFFSSGGSVGATGEAARGRLTTAPCAPGVGAGGGRRRAVGWAGPAGGAVRWARPAGRLWPSGGGEENRPVKEKEEWAERPGGPKVMGRILFRIKIDF
jgi:hypothetical protein